MRLTVMGCAGTHPAADRACSSYLVEHDGYRLLVDCGNGALSNVQKTLDPADIDAVLLSHLHVDHFGDLYGLYYALRFHGAGPRSVPVHAPPGADRHIAQLLHGDPDDSFHAVCRFSEARPGDTLELGPLRVELHAANHPITTLAPRISAAGAVLAYTADSGPADTLVDCARDADLLLADCSWLERMRPLPEGVHMTAREAGELAQRAGAARLVVTHVYPANDLAEAAAEAAEAYGGEILIARDLLELDL
ncbi:MAG TPA: MBL fold metallo-hydrolase [Egibacteraceae bacterium]|nr:MBL fold metallo-hydrolase [Egibacteraceae bacterium]